MKTFHFLKPFLRIGQNWSFLGLTAFCAKPIGSNEIRTISSICILKFNNIEKWVFHKHKPFNKCAPFSATLDRPIKYCFLQLFEHLGHWNRGNMDIRNFRPPKTFEGVRDRFAFGSEDRVGGRGAQGGSIHKRSARTLVNHRSDGMGGWGGGWGWKGIVVPGRRATHVQKAHQRSLNTPGPLVPRGRRIL